MSDNIFYKNSFSRSWRVSVTSTEAGRTMVFGYYVPDPERFGVAAFDENSKDTSIEGKFKNPGNLRS